MPAAVPQGVQRPRLAWADAAKGICIALVVLHHVTGKQYLAALPADLEMVAGPWLWVMAALKPLRMPLFFVLSGFFAATALGRSWRSVASARVVSLYYLYVVWLTIQAVVFTFETTLPANRTHGVGEYVEDLAYASTGVWYLYALAAYFVVAKALGAARRPRVVLAVAGVVSALGWVVPLEGVNRGAVLQCFVYFAAGACFPAWVSGVAAYRSRFLTPALAVGYVGAVSVALWQGWPALVLCVVAVPMAIRVVAALAVWPRVTAGLGYLGQRTLPVYVLHMPVLAAVAHLPSPVPGPQVPGLSAGAGWVLATGIAVVYPVLVSAVLISVCLVTHAVAPRVGLGWLFARPHWGPVARAVVRGVPDRFPARGQGPGTSVHRVQAPTAGLRTAAR